MTLWSLLIGLVGIAIRYFFGKEESLGDSAGYNGPTGSDGGGERCEIIQTGDCRDEPSKLEEVKETDNKNKREQTEASVVNLHVQNSEGGIVIVGNNASCTSVNEASSSKTIVQELHSPKQNAQPCFSGQSDLKDKDPAFAIEQQDVTPAGAEQFGNSKLEHDLRKGNQVKKINKKRPNGESRTKEKISSFDRKLKTIQETLCGYRGNGEWDAHDRELEEVRSKYKNDEDYNDVVLLLDYEQAAGLYARNNLAECQKLVSKVGDKTSKKAHRSNNRRNQIFFRCSLLKSKLYSHPRSMKLGKAEKYLEIARSVNLHDPVLQAELHLTSAGHHFKQLHCSPRKLLAKVTEETDKADKVSAVLRKNDKESWREIRRNLLLTKARAAIELYHEVYKKNSQTEELADTITRLLDEVEKELWDGIFQITKVEFHVLKCDYAMVSGQLSLAQDHAHQGLAIAQECKFIPATELLKQRIGNLQNSPGSHNMPTKRGTMLDQINAITTSDSACLESNAADATDRGLFNSDFSSDEFPEGEDRQLPTVNESSDEECEAEETRFQADDGSERERVESREHSLLNESGITSDGDDHLSRVPCDENIDDKKNGHDESFEVVSEQAAAQARGFIGEASNSRDGQLSFQHIATDGDTTGTHGAEAVPDNERFTPCEKTRLAKKLGSHWIPLRGLLNIDDEKQQDISRSINLYPDLPSKGRRSATHL